MTSDGRALSQNGAEETVCSGGGAEIPKFNLAEDIMAEQRRITTIRRKAPVKKIEGRDQRRPGYGSLRRDEQVESIDYTIGQPAPSGQDQTIAEIVARDIERMCRGRKSG